MYVCMYVCMYMHVCMYVRACVAYLPLMYFATVLIFNNKMKDTLL